MKDRANIINRYNELISLIEKYNYNYYNLDAPLVDDSEYDYLMQELIDIENKYPDMKAENSPSQKVSGFASKTFSEAKHDPPMLSLGNVFTGEELLEFDERCKKNLGTDKDIVYCGELKFDGLAVESIYENGKFVKGAGAEGFHSQRDECREPDAVWPLPSMTGPRMAPCSFRPSQ